MKKLIALSVVCVLALASAFSQTILTASEFFKSVSEYYGTISDYEADVSISVGNADPMTGKVSFKRPEMLRIDFSRPAEQTILFNGETLTIYLPGSSAILQQTVTTASKGSMTPDGLSLLRRYYSVAYETGQDAVPLDEGSPEMVVNLILHRRTASEAFSTIKLSIDPSSKLIRRVIAKTPSNVVYTFYYSGYRINTGLSDQRFIYDPPSSANNYNNFLFSE